MMAIDENPLVKSVKEFKDKGVCPICGYAGVDTKDPLMGTKFIGSHADFALRYKSISKCMVADYVETESRLIQEENSKGGEASQDSSWNISGPEEPGSYWTGKQEEAVESVPETIEPVENFQESAPEEGMPGMVSMSSGGTRPSDPISAPRMDESRRERGTIGGTIGGPVKKKTGDQVFREMEELFGEDIPLYRSEVISAYGDFIHALVIVFNRNVEFAMGKMSTAITDNKAQRYLSNIENTIRELGHLSQKFPNMPVKKYIIFREARGQVSRAGLSFMDKNIEAVAEMIGKQTLMQLKHLYDSGS